MPRTAALVRAEVTIPRLQLLKVADHVMESATRIRVAFASPASTRELSRCMPAA